MVKNIREIQKLSSHEVRQLMRENKWELHGCAVGLLGYVICNLVVLPKDLALEFMIFCQRNPKPCTILEVTEVGSAEPKITAPNSDLRTDLPKYCVYENGMLTEEVTDIIDYWRDDFVCFLIAEAATWAKTALEAGVPIRHLEKENVEAGKGCPIYITDIQCRPYGRFHGPMVVTMRPIPEDKIVRVIQVSSRFPMAHGAPVHIGSPEKIGIKDISEDIGKNSIISLKPRDIPVFWACGVTTQIVGQYSKPEIMITHSGGFPFVTDLKNEELAVF